MNKKWMILGLLLLSAFLPQDAIASQTHQNQSMHNNSQAYTSDDTAFLLSIINSSVTNNNQSIDPHANLDLNFDIDPYASLDIDIDTSIAASSSASDKLPLPPSSRSSQERKATVLDNSVAPSQKTVPSITTATLSTNNQPSKKKEKALICNYIVNPGTGKTCGKGFRYPSSLKEHMRIHTGDKPYKCTHAGCDKAFSQSGSLTIHTRNHTGERPYKCTHTGCNMAFTQSGHLIDHTRNHTGERPYKCTHTGCDMAFFKSDTLTDHIRAHTGERLYQCTHTGCYMAFNLRSTLTRHKAVHTREKAYQCTICDRSFTQKYRLTSHTKSKRHIDAVAAALVLAQGGNNE